ncbi:MAG: hypothetical protein GF355_11915 [Candidatus Eisenbacteria bacterium]|nr:hypothetical protein [Candidatus Eisenbacteria bacterium]
MRNPDGNAALPGGISLNTVAWDWAPWLQSFRRKLDERWKAPLGYLLGWISGWSLVELEIAPGGELLRLEVLESAGHQALTDTNVNVLRVMAPYDPLPDDFPEEHLILQIKMVYPERER